MSGSLDMEDLQKNVQASLGRFGSFSGKDGQGDGLLIQRQRAGDGEIAISVCPAERAASKGKGWRSFIMVVGPWINRLTEHAWAPRGHLRQAWSQRSQRKAQQLATGSQ